MELFDCIISRRSVRKFQDKEIDDDLIKKLVLAGGHAPTACNFQAMKFILVTEDQVKKDLSVKGSNVILKSKLGIVVCYRNDIYVTGRKHFDYIQSGAAVIQNMLLTAHDMGLCGCWVCDLPKEETLRSILKVPKYYIVLTYVAFGYPDKILENTLEEQLYHYGDVESFKMHKRKYSFEQICSYNTFCSVEGDSITKKYPSKE